MRPYFFRLGFAISSPLLIVAATACGGSTKSSDAKTPIDGPPAAVVASEDRGGSTASNATTTTTQLGDGGDLQGAKLGATTHTATEVKGQGGPKTTHGQSANEPGRSVNDIQTIVSARRDEARACYERGLTSRPELEGDIDIKFVIDPQGNVSDASVDTTKSQILEPSVGACIVDILKKIKFAPSAKGYESRAHYPFNFHPRKSTGKEAGK